jgi:glycosyltransferase involved in cell wall biosynthesis
MTPAAVTIVTPTFRSAATVERCLASVHGQSVPVEHVLVDGASPDGSADLARAFAARGVAGSLTVVSEPDQGMYDAMNKGIRRSTADVVGILNADDRYASPDVLARVLDLFADPSVDAVYGDLVYVDASDRVVRRWRSGGYDVSRFRWGWMPPHPAFFLRRRFYEAHGLYRTDFGTAADYELMLRMLLVHGLRARHLPAELVRMQAGGASNRALVNRLRAHAMDRRAWGVNGLTPYPWTLLCKPLRKLIQWLA